MIAACNVRAGHEKGRVESAVGYVKKNLLAGPGITDFSQLNPIARHPRSYDRHRDFEDPDHPKALLAQRRSARQQRRLQRFLSLAPCAERYYAQLQQRRLNPGHHIRKILALSEIHGEEAAAGALAGPGDRDNPIARPLPLGALRR